MPPLSLFIALYALGVPDRRPPPAVAAPEKKSRDLQLADNRKAQFDYAIEDPFEDLGLAEMVGIAGAVLQAVGYEDAP